MAKGFINPANTLVPWQKVCKKVGHREMIHISRARVICKNHDPVYLFHDADHEFQTFHMVNIFPIQLLNDLQ